MKEFFLQTVHFWLYSCISLRQNIFPIVWSTLSYKLACMNSRVKYHIAVQEEVTRFPQGPITDFSHWAFWLEPCLGATLCHQYSPNSLFQSLATNIWAPQLEESHLPGHCGRRRAGLEPCGSRTLTASETLLAGCSAGLRVWMVPWKSQGMASVQQWAGLRKWCAGVLGLLTGPGWAGPQPSSYNLRDTLAAGPWHNEWIWGNFPVRLWSWVEYKQKHLAGYQFSSQM
jgi:hypothetical protein